MKKLVALVFALSCNSLIAHETTFTIDKSELALTIEQGNYQEAINYLPMISPSNRDQKWKDMAVLAFNKQIMLNTASGQHNSNLQLGEIIKNQFTHLLSKAELMTPIFHSGLISLPDCNANFNQLCMQELGYLLSFQSKGPELASIVAQKMNNHIAISPIENIQLFELAARFNNEDICINEKLESSIIDAAASGITFYQNLAVNIVTKYCSKHRYLNLEDKLHRDEDIQDSMCTAMHGTKQLGKISIMVCKDQNLI